MSETFKLFRLLLDVKLFKALQKLFLKMETAGGGLPSFILVTTTTNGSQWLTEFQYQAISKVSFPLSGSFDGATQIFFASILQCASSFAENSLKTLLRRNLWKQNECYFFGTFEHIYVSYRRLITVKTFSFSTNV